MTISTPTMIDAFARLVETPSISCVDPWFDQSNRKVVELLADWLEDLGMQVVIKHIEGSEGKYNLIARIGDGYDGLVLAGHTDTVPYDEAAWDFDPFKLTEQDGKYYGLGTADMKGFFPLVMEVVKQIDKGAMKHPLTILATADEESSMSGAKALMDAGENLGRYAIIGEPTGLKPIIKHKGILAESIELIGQAGHSSDPSLGNNAIEGMNRVINHLMQWRQEIQSQYRDESFAVPFPTMNFGAIKGGDNPNRICAECELKMDMRIVPGMQIEQLRDELHQEVNRCLTGSGLVVNFTPSFSGIEAMQTQQDSAIVNTLEELTGNSSGTVAFGTEGPYFNALGMDTVILGPGNINVAHQGNEYLEQSTMQPMIDIMNKLVQRFCYEENQ